MVMHLDLEQSGGVSELSSQADVCLAGGGVSRRMVVDENEGGCRPGDHGAENLSGVGDALVQCASCDFRDVKEIGSIVE